jgi:hypothetical protein
MEIMTTKGPLREDSLEKREIFETREEEWVIAVEWRLRYGPKDQFGQFELVKRDCHVVKKKPMPESTAVAGGLG